MSRLKDIPELASDARNLVDVIQALREALQTYRGYRGDPLDAALTLRDFGVDSKTKGMASALVRTDLRSYNFVHNVSGWALNSLGSAEFQNAVVRGTIYTGAGLIGGSAIGSDYVQTSNYVPGVTGWTLNASGYAEFQNALIRGTVHASAGAIGGSPVGATYIRSSNYVLDTTGWRLGADGAFEANSGTYRGALSGATGSFTGEHNTGDFTGYGWPAAGGTGVHVSAQGLKAGNSTVSAGNPAGKYWHLATPSGGVPTLTTNIPSYLEDLQVTTAKLANNAATVPASAMTTGALAITAVEATAQTLVVTSTGAPIMLLCGAVFSVVGTNTTVKVYRGATVLYTITLPPGNALFIPPFIDTPAAGTWTYSFGVADTVSATITHRSIVAVELKK